jgi:hypothetical protein
VRGVFAVRCIRIQGRFLQVIRGLLGL